MRTIIILRIQAYPSNLKLQIEAKEAEEDKKKNEAFEKSNKEFCDMFSKDMEERSKAIKEKDKNCDSLRIKGNKLFNKKDFHGALAQYMDAMKLRPYDIRIIMNIAQVCFQIYIYIFSNVYSSLLFGWSRFT